MFNLPVYTNDISRTTHGHLVGAVGAPTRCPWTTPLTGRHILIVLHLCIFSFVFRQVQQQDG